MKVAIIGAGLAGLACASELEKNGVIPDVFEKDLSLGWAWSSVNFWPNVLYRSYGDVREYLLDDYGIDIRPLAKCTKNILKSPNRETVLEGDLGYLVVRGKNGDSLESQLMQQLSRVSVNYNSPMDYKKLSNRYDWVVVASGGDVEARELGVWEDGDVVRIFGEIALGDFENDFSTLYLNTGYAGTGYGRISPFNTNQAIIALNIFGRNEIDSAELFEMFLKTEGLDKLEYIYKFILPPFTNGRVKKFRIGNVLLTGRAAGLTESFIGTGGVESLASGVLAARAITQGKDYDQLVKPLQKHIDNISSFRSVINNSDNDGFDKLLSFLGAPGIKQTIYNTKINFADLIGGVLKRIKK